MAEKFAPIVSYTWRDENTAVFGVDPDITEYAHVERLTILMSLAYPNASIKPITTGTGYELIVQLDPAAKNKLFEKSMIISLFNSHLATLQQIQIAAMRLLQEPMVVRVAFDRSLSKRFATHLYLTVRGFTIYGVEISTLPVYNGHVLDIFVPHVDDEQQLSALQEAVQTACWINIYE